ncbi:MAG: hypothetical protein R6U17_09280 [Thermoplasmata archaeon]
MNNLEKRGYYVIYLPTPWNCEIKEDRPEAMAGLRGEEGIIPGR